VAQYPRPRWLSIGWPLTVLPSTSLLVALAERGDLVAGPVGCLFVAPCSSVRAACSVPPALFRPVGPTDENSSRDVGSGCSISPRPLSGVPPLSASDTVPRLACICSPPCYRDGGLFQFDFIAPYQLPCPVFPLHLQQEASPRTNASSG
jgi:hypothetical protein